MIYTWIISIMQLRYLKTCSYSYFLTTFLYSTLYLLLRVYLHSTIKHAYGFMYRFPLQFDKELTNVNELFKIIKWMANCFYFIISESDEKWEGDMKIFMKTVLALEDILDQSQVDDIRDSINKIETYRKRRHKWATYGLKQKHKSNLDSKIMRLFNGNN